MTKFTIAILIFGILIFSGFGIYHEQAHVQIYRSYGIESHVEYFSSFPDFVTITEPFPKGQCTEECILANNLNEVVGYHLTMVLVILIVLMYILTFYLDILLEIKLREKQ